MSWLTQSKASSISQKMPLTLDLLFIAAKTSFINVKAAFSIEIFFGNRID
jgi:hypothetical protein